MKNKKIIKIILCVIILSIYVFLITPKYFQNDTLFDIKLGEKYITDGITALDDFSIHENLEYIPQHFLVNILTYEIYDHLGFWGLYILCLILTLTLALLLYIANKLFVNNKLLSYMLVFLQLILLSTFISIRAQMYSYIFFLLELIFIEKFLRGKKNIYLVLLSLLPLLIINFHAGTIYFYFIIILVYFLNYIPINTSKIENNKKYVTNLKYLLIPLFLGIIFIFVNPFGIKQITYCLKTLNNSFINTYIAEFQPLTIKSYQGELFYISLLVILISFLYNNNKIKLEHFLFLIGTAFMSLFTIRHSSLFILFTIPCLGYVKELILRLKVISYKGLIESGKKAIKIVGISLFFSVVFLYTLFKSNLLNKTEYLPKEYYPFDSVKYIKENVGNNSRIFNSYAYGTLLMYNDIKVFIDSRLDLYTKEYTKDCEIAYDYINIINCTGNYEELLSKYNIEYLIIEKKSALAQNIFNNSKYKKVFEDEISYVIKVN